MRWTDAYRTVRGRQARVRAAQSHFSPANSTAGTLTGIPHGLKRIRLKGGAFFFFFSNSSGTNQQLHCACVAMGNAYLDVEKCPTILCHLKNSIELSLPAGWYWIFSSFLVHNQFVTVKCWFRSRLVCYIHVKTQSAMQWNENNLSTCCKIQKY